MAWNVEATTNPKPPKRFERTAAAVKQPEGQSVYTAILLTLDRYPEARAAVVRALREQIGMPDDEDSP
jgi:hypothetical protein